MHIKEFERQGRRPVTGDLIAYAVQRDAKGRLNATGVRFGVVRAKPDPVRRGRFPRKVVAVLALAALVTGWLLHKLPIEILFVYVVLSGIAVFLYAFDKSAAGHGRWRTKESTLHLVALLGGWPGALLAQGLFRHKSKKVEFQIGFWLTVLVNCAGLAWVLQSGALEL